MHLKPGSDAQIFIDSHWRIFGKNVDNTQEKFFNRFLRYLQVDFDA